MVNANSMKLFTMNQCVSKSPSKVREKLLPRLGEVARSAGGGERPGAVDDMETVPAFGGIDAPSPLLSKRGS